MAKKKIVGFFAFVKEYMKQHGITNTEIAKQRCSEIWPLMDEAARKPYHDLARELNAQQKPSKFISIPAESLRAKAIEHEQEFYKDTKVHLISSLVDVCKTVEEILSKEFVIMSTNVMCRTNDGYLPIEFGLLRYSIKDGIKETYTKFVDPGDIPIGYASTAYQHAELTHKIPFDTFFTKYDLDNPPSLEEKEAKRKQKYQKVALNIIDFVKKCGNKAEASKEDDHLFIFSVPSQIEQNISCLKFLCQNATHPVSYSNFEVLDLIQLHYHITKRSGTYRPLAVCEEDFNVSYFDYSPGCCRFHEAIECMHCAMGHSYRLAYMLSNVLCLIFNIPLTDKHVPAETLKSLIGSSAQPNAHSQAERQEGKPQIMWKGKGRMSVTRDETTSKPFEMARLPREQGAQSNTIQHLPSTTGYNKDHSEILSSTSFSSVPEFSPCKPDSKPDFTRPLGIGRGRGRFDKFV